jgi:hypothetical protein
MLAILSAFSAFEESTDQIVVWLGCTNMLLQAFLRRNISAVQGKQCSFVFHVDGLGVTSSTRTVRVLKYIAVNPAQGKQKNEAFNLIDGQTA